MITFNLSPPSTYPHCSLLVCQKRSSCNHHLWTDNQITFLSQWIFPLSLPWSNASSQHFSKPNLWLWFLLCSHQCQPWCSVHLLSHTLAWCYIILQSLGISFFSFRFFCLRLLSELLSLACPHHSIIIYRPFNDTRKSRTQKIKWMKTF